MRTCLATKGSKLLDHALVYLYLTGWDRANALPSSCWFGLQGSMEL